MKDEGNIASNSKTDNPENTSPNKINAINEECLDE